MASLFSENFETSGSAFWADTGGTEETSIVHSGSKSWKFTANSDYHTVTAINELWMSFWFRMPSFGAVWVINFENSGNYLDTLKVNSSGYLELYRDYTTLLATGTTPLSVDTWYNVKVHIKIADSGGIFEAKLGTDVEVTYTGDTKPGTQTTLNRINFGGGGTYYFDDVDGDDAGYPGEAVTYSANVSDSTSVTESASAEVTGTPPDLGLSVSDSTSVSESCAALYTGELPYAVSDTVHVSDNVTFIETSSIPQAPRVSGIINGNQIAGYVRSLRRVCHICNPGQHATLVLSPDWPHGVRPGRMVFLYENDLQIMKGFVIRVVRSRPSYDWVVEIDDTYTLVVSTFLAAQEFTTAGHDTAYWADYILQQCGADYKINGTPAMVPAGVQIGLRPASEALKDILAYASWYAWPDKNGTIQIGRFDRSISARTITEFTKFEYDLSDDMTRNVIKVYGSGRIFAVSSTSVPGIDPDRIAVVGSSLIGSYAEAQRVGDYMIAELGDLTRIIRGTIPGNPKIKIGNVVTMTYEMDGTRYSVTDTVSSLEANYSIDSGYEMELTVGERCPRIAGYSAKVPYTYAGLNGNGVYVSRDKGVTWSAMNSGLPATAVASRVAGDSYGKALAIINNSLWYETGSNWQLATIPTLYGMPTSVGSLGGMDSFAVLTSGSVYFSIPSSGSEPPEDPTVSSGSISDWTPVSITTTDLTTGSMLYGHGYDMYTKTGTAYVNAVTSGSSSGSTGSWYGTGGYSGGAVTMVLFGTHITSTYASDGFDPILGYTKGDVFGPWGAQLKVISPNYPGEGYVIEPGVFEIAIRVLALGSAYPDGYPASLTVRGTLWAEGEDGEADLYLYGTNITPGYYSSGKADPSNIGLGGYITCGTGVEVNFELSNSPNTANWWKDGYFEMQLSAKANSYAGTVKCAFSILEIEVTYEDGGGTITYTPTPTTGSASYNLYTVSPNGAILVSTIPSAASYDDRLYVSDDGEVVLYNSDGKLLISNDFGGTWHSAYPSSAPTKVAAVTRAQQTSTELITSGSYSTVIGAVTSGSSTEVSYQAAIETSGGWSAAGNPPATFAATDAIWSRLSTQGVLLGGGGYATKIYRYDPAEAPFATPVASDTGIPSATASNVLDLEFGE